MTTQIKAVYLARSYNNNQLEGNVTFNNSMGEIKINIPADKISRIVAAIAEELVAAAQETAKVMVEQVLEDSRTTKVLTTVGQLNV